MSIQKIKRSMISILRNIPGRSIGKKIVVIECDDWCSIGMPSKQVHDQLLKAGLEVNKSRYDRNDTLESEADLTALFSVLSKHKDRDGKHAVISPFCNMANPDFEQIKKDNFQVYHREIFTDTYKRYGRSASIMDVWEQGMNAGIFVPEYHGREHIATDLWLRSLQQEGTSLRLGFEHGYVGHSSREVPEVAKNFRPNFYIADDSAMNALRCSLKDGVDIFKWSFGFDPVVFNAPNGVFISALNRTLLKKGIRFNAVPRKRLDRNAGGVYGYKTFATGQKSPEGLVYYARNCNFEPTEDSYRDTDHVMSQINGAFTCGKAAIIGTHRTNFVGGINESNRKQGLAELDKLLKRILLRWPDVRFMSSRAFTDLLDSKR